MKEIWKDIEGYEGSYQVSNFGRVKSFMFSKEKIRKMTICKGYYYCCLNKKKKRKNCAIHILVWDAFGDKPRNGHKLQVDHIIEDKLNNRIDNLQLLTCRENTSKGFLKFNKSSKYVGVSSLKGTKKWRSDIYINGKREHLGLFKNEYDAHLAYQKELEQINN